jgi:hypothetical protein
MSMADIAVCNGDALEASFLPQTLKKAIKDKYFS